jgi:phage-related baseplate assembly protein
MSTIDLSQLPAPTIIEALSFETILSQLKADFLQRYPAFDADLLSEPAIKLLEVAAYRELIIRARINDAAKACMLAYALDSDLDHAAVLVGVTRLTDNGQIETDAQLRQRAQMALEGYTVAGSIGSYITHARAASLAVLDVAVDSPTPGEVRLTILANSPSGAADAALCARVQSYLSADDRRPLNDIVNVVSVTPVPFAIEATLYLFPGPSSAPVLATAQTALNKYLDDVKKIGYDVTRSGIFAALHQSGVRQVVLTQPANDIEILSRQVGVCSSITINEGPRDV